MKETWLESYLINISRQPNKLILDNQFDEIIIILNKKNINLFVNAKSDKFFYKTMLQKILLKKLFCRQLDLSGIVIAI